MLSTSEQEQTSNGVRPVDQHWQKVQFVDAGPHWEHYYKSKAEVETLQVASLDVTWQQGCDMDEGLMDGCKLAQTSSLT